MIYFIFSIPCCVGPHEITDQLYNLSTGEAKHVLACWQPYFTLTPFKWRFAGMLMTAQH